ARPAPSARSSRARHMRSGSGGWVTCPYMVPSASFGSHHSGGTMTQAVSPTTDRPSTQNMTAGFDSLEQETRVDRLPVEGELRGWLRGPLLRTGPAKWEVGQQTMRHWFDGFAMLHHFGIADGNVSYANRFLETKTYRAAKEKGALVYHEFATDP